MLRKITSSSRGCLEILKAISEDGRHLYSMSVIAQVHQRQASRYASTKIGDLAVETRRPHRNSRYNLPNKLIVGMSQDKYNALRERQVRLETEAWTNATIEYEELLTKMCEQQLAPNIPYIKSLFLGWFEPFKNAIIAQRKNMRKCWGYASCFEELPPEMMAVITMHKLTTVLIMGAGNGTATVMEASLQIGQAIEQEAKIHRSLGQAKITHGPNSNVEDSPTEELVGLLNNQNQRIVKAKRNDDSKPWGLENQAKVGSKLIHLLIETALVQPPVDQSFDSPPDLRPAFIHIKNSVSNDSSKGGNRYGVIKCDPLVWEGVENSVRHMVFPPYMPMVVPPLDWIGFDKGAYLFLPSYVMRTTHGAREQRVALKTVPKDQLKTVYEALNVLGNTKWCINKKMLCIVERIWASGGGLADLVDREDIPIPEKPDKDDASEIGKWKWIVYNVKKENAERHSKRCVVELKLAVARKMMDEEGFYYPHSVDFRGRAYPMHPYLNHLGDDLCRGILEFAEGRPLRASGLRWLKIHIANLYAGGVDRLTNEGRIAFTENHLVEIFDSADTPLEGGRWWLNAEYPFQCLAACVDLSKALRSSSPEDYVSYLTVHQDGSCNGLQHYAALGRDKLGAKAVNLVAGDKPADVYSDVAKRALEILRRDAEKDPSIEPNAPCAKLLLDQVDRNLVKQTVMTSVYGVTFIGARDQIKNRLKERNVIADDRELFAAASYATKVTMTAQGEIFVAARSIMNWLVDCAKVISSENQPVQWTTPVGLPVVQPYRKVKQRCIKTSLQMLTFLIDTDKIMSRQQISAFPPNFVHSLNASHMMMTAIACKRLGLAFAGVHDSYWTHACDVDEMNRILREKFVELHEQPILENLLESFQTTFPKLKFPPLPQRGDLDLRNVLESPYFFN